MRFVVAFGMVFGRILSVFIGQIMVAVGLISLVGFLFVITRFM